MEKNRATLKEDFSTGKTITEAKMSDVFDSTYNKSDDKIEEKYKRLETAIWFLADDRLDCLDALNEFLANAGYEPIDKP